MDKYEQLNSTAATKILVVLQSDANLSDCFKQAQMLFGYGYVTAIDLNGKIAEPGETLLFAGEDWTDVGLSQPHWQVGPADLKRVGCFQGDVGCSYVSRDDMITIIKGHIAALKGVTIKITEPGALKQAEAEIKRLKKLLKLNNIKF